MDPEETPNSKRSITDRLIISETSRWKAIFDIIMTLAVAYSCVTTVYFVAIHKPTETAIIVFDYVIEGFFWLDLIFNFLLEYRDPDTYKSVRKHKLIAKKYIFK